MINGTCTPELLRDEWQTPPFITSWIKFYTPFDVDLCATKDNALAKTYFSKQENCLDRDWHKFGKVGYCNPPYSNVRPFLEKAIQERDQGFRSIFLIPSPNGERHYHDCVFGQADKIVFITGRLSFSTPQNKPVNGNPRGSCLIYYTPNETETRMEWVDRDVMRRRTKSIKKEFTYGTGY